MRIGPQLIRWAVLVQLTFVALVPIAKDAIDNIAPANSTFLDKENGSLSARGGNKELTQPEEVRYKRQIDDSDDEFKPRPSDLVKEEANIESRAFFFPMKNNTIEDTKLDTSGSRINYIDSHLEKVKKSSIDNTLIPLYDEDVETDLDPLSGVLDPKYWEEGEDDASSKIINFFEKTPIGGTVGFKSEDNTEKELNNKDVNLFDKGNTDQHLYEEKSSCYSNSQFPNHLLNKPTNYEKNYKYKKDDNKFRTNDRRKFGKKVGKASTEEENADTNPVVVDPTGLDENNNEYMHIQNIMKSSQIHSGLISNLGNVINNLVKDVVAGTIDDLDNKTVKFKELEESNRNIPVGDTVGLSEEIGGDNFSSNFGRRLLSINEEGEEHLDESHNRGGSGYDRENYFAVDSNMDSLNQELKKQNTFNIIKNAILGVHKSPNVDEDKSASDFSLDKTISNVVEGSIPFENTMNGLDGNFSQMRKRNVLSSRVRYPRKNRRRQVNLQGPLEDNSQEAISLEEKELSKSKVKDSTEKAAGESSTHHVSTATTSPHSSTYVSSGHHNTTGKGEHGYTTVLPTNVTGNMTAQSVDYEDERSNIELSNKVVDAIFAQAQARGDMRNTLGICRKSGDLKNLKGSKMVEDKSDSIIEEIMRCVSTLLKGHQQKTMCLSLDDSLHDFLRWMLLTGESMHGKGFVAQKPDKDRSEFLFPSMCAGETASESGPSQKPKIPKSSYS